MNDFVDILLLVVATAPAVAFGVWWAGARLRRRTGSLVFPMLAHNGANLATYAWVMLSR